MGSGFSWPVSALVPNPSAADGSGLEEHIRVDPTDLSFVYKDGCGCQPIDLEN